MGQFHFDFITFKLQYIASVELFFELRKGIEHVSFVQFNRIIDLLDEHCLNVIKDVSCITPESNSCPFSDILTISNLF